MDAPEYVKFVEIVGNNLCFVKGKVFQKTDFCLKDDWVRSTAELDDLFLTKKRSFNRKILI